MKNLAFACSFLLAVGCGDVTPDKVESKEGAFNYSGTFRGSYQCGSDWWHVEQPINWATNVPVTATIPHPASFPTGSASSNAVTVLCWTSSIPMAWGGVSYYNTADVNGPPSNPYQCVMYSHRPNKPWSYAAYVQIPVGSLQLYPGSPPTTWGFEAYNASTTGTHDGIGTACGGHFLLLLQ